MRHERNTEGIRQNAQKKRQEAFDRTEEAIKQLIKEGRAINFKTVAEVAEVSTAWLYKEPEIKSRIEHLRQQGSKKQKSVPIQQKATDASKDAKYQALKQRLQRVEAENRGLREHLEAIHGRQRVLADENEAQQREIERLKKLLTDANAEIERIKQGIKVSKPISAQEDGVYGDDTIPISKVTPLNTHKASSSDISPEIQSKIDSLQIELNPTLIKTVRSFSEDRILSAIETLKEAQSKGDVPNPSGFLVKAIKEGWTVSEGYIQKSGLEIFKQWYSLAYPLKLVQAATLIEGVQHVLTQDGNWLPFTEMLAKYSLEKLINSETELPQD